MHPIPTLACILFPRLRVQVELARRPELAGRDAVIVERSASQPSVVDVLSAAAVDQWAGPVEPGLSLERVLSDLPNAVILEADEPGYQREFERALAALSMLSDRIEVESLGVVYVGLDGLAEMHGGESQLFEALRAAASSVFEPRIGAAAAKFPAYAAACSTRRTALVCVGPDAARSLAPLPIGLLTAELAPPELLDDLRRLGLYRLGDVAAQDGDALLDRFGLAGRQAWQLANGIDERPLRPRAHEESLSEALALPAAAASLDLLRIAVETLLARLSAQPRMQGRSAGAAELCCTLEDAPNAEREWRRTFHFKGGIGDGLASRQRAAEIITQRLERDHPPAPVEAMAITLSELRGASGVQLSLFPDARADREQRLLAVERELRARMGGQPALHRLVEAAPWHPAPELRTLQVPLELAATDTATDTTSSTAQQMRPLAAAAAVEVEEGPGQEPLAIQIDRRWRRIERIDDHWSFDLWWRPTPIQRCYYRVCAESGRQLTLYRDQHADRWYRQAG